MVKGEKRSIWKDWKTWAIIVLVIIIFSNFNSQGDTWDYQICISDCMADNFDCSTSKTLLIEDYGGYIHKLDYELCHYDLEDCLYECE